MYIKVSTVNRSFISVVALGSCAFAGLGLCFALTGWGVDAALGQLLALALADLDHVLLYFLPAGPHIWSRCQVPQKSPSFQAHF